MKVEPRQKTAAERLVDIERLKALYRAHARSVRARENDAHTSSAGPDILLAFRSFVDAVGAALTTNGCAVEQVHIDHSSASLTVRDPSRESVDSVTLLLWEDGTDSRIAVFLDLAGGSSTGDLPEIWLPFTVEKARLAAMQAITLMRPS